MNQATPPTKTRTGQPLSGACRLNWGHQYCSPGPVMVDDIEVLPRKCYCLCHGKVKR